MTTGIEKGCTDDDCWVPKMGPRLALSGAFLIQMLRASSFSVDRLVCQVKQTCDQGHKNPATPKSLRKAGQRFESGALLRLRYCWKVGAMSKPKEVKPSKGHDLRLMDFDALR